MKRYFGAFSAFRFIAFLTVFARHVACYDITDSLGMGAGWAVSFFFMNSAFLYGYKLSGRKMAYSDTLGIIRKKIRKIYPLYLLMILLWLPYCGLLSLGVNLKQTLIKLILCATMTQSLAVNLDYTYSFNPASWFVSTLMILMLLVVPLNNFINKHLSTTKKGILWCFIFFILDILYVDIVNWLNLPKTTFLYVFPTSRIFEFAIGMTLGHMVRTIDQKSKRNVTKATVVEMALLILVALGVGYLTKIFPKYENAVVWVIPNSLIMLVFAKEGGAISKLLKKKIFDNLGKLSFPAYLIHQYVYLTFYLVSGVVSGESDVESPKQKALRFCYLLFMCLALAWVANKIDFSAFFSKIDAKRERKRYERTKLLYLSALLW